MTGPTSRVPDPGPDDDPRVQAAVAAFAERVLAGVDFEPIAPTRRRTPLRVALALAGVAAAAALLVPLATGRFAPTPVPAVPGSGPESGLAQCLAGLTADDIAAGSAKVTGAELRIVGSVVQRFEDDQNPSASTTRLSPVPVIVSDNATGESDEVAASTSALIWRAAIPGNDSGDFLHEPELARWVRDGVPRLVDRATGVFAAVYQQAAVTIVLEVRCGGEPRSLTATGFGSMVRPYPPSTITWLDCSGPDTDVSDLSDELAAFARNCHDLA